MKSPFTRLAEPAYAAFRIVAGFLFAFHGAQKLFGMFGGTAQPIASLFGLAGIIELTCGVLVGIGWLTPFAAFLASGEMAAAYFIAHAPKGPWPIQNGGELAALYFFAFLFIATRGGGMLSVDRR